MKKLLAVFFILFTFISTWGLTQHGTIQSLGIKDGLSMGYICALAEDQNEFVWMGTYFGLNRYNGKEIKQYIPDHFDPWALHANIIFSIAVDNHGLLWLGTEHGLVVMDPVTERFVHVSEVVSSIPAFRVTDVHVQADGQVCALQADNTKQWILTIRPEGGWKACFRNGNTSGMKLTLKKINFPGEFQGQSSIFYPYQNHFILLKDEKNALFSLSLSAGTIHPFSDKKHSFVTSGSGNVVLKIDGKRGLPLHIQEDTKQAVVAPGEEILFPSPEKQLITRFYDTKIRYFQEDKNVEDLPVFCEIDKPCSGAYLVDKKGNVWVGTTGFGVRKIAKENAPDLIEAKGKSFYNLALLPSQQLWPGYLQQDVIYSYKKKAFEPAPWKKMVKTSESVRAVHYSNTLHTYFLVIENTDKKTLILKQFDRLTGVFLSGEVSLQNYTNAPPVLLEDAQGTIWVSGIKGEIVRFDPRQEKTTRFSLSDYCPATIQNELNSFSITESQAGELWIGNSLGLVNILCRSAKPAITTYFNLNEEKKLFKNNGVFCVVQDNKDNNILWLGTLGGGLASFDKKRKTVTYYHGKENYNIIAGIVQTDNLLWLSTDLNILCFDKISRKYLPVKEINTGADTDFNVMACGKTDDNRLVFGTTNGLLLFDKMDILYPEEEVQIHLNALEVQNKGIRKLLDKNMLTIGEDNIYHLSLDHDQNSMQLDFCAPASSYASSIAFEYRLLPADTLWKSMYQGHILPLIDIHPGKYVLEVRTVHEKSRALAPMQLSIEIRPPWYLSVVAKIVYILIVLSMIATLFAYDRNRVKLAYESRLHQAEVDSLKSLALQKNRFITYLVHEFKSPLALINSLTQKGNVPDELANLNTQNALIQRESQNMLRVIDELIDLSKLKEGNITPQYVSGDVHTLIREVCSSLQWWCDNKKVHFEYEFAGNQLLTSFDNKRLSYILNNLLLNAIRFSHPKGKIVIHTNETAEIYTITITDFGVGIQQQSLPHIFNAYYQANDGAYEKFTYGLGLSFVRELVQIMGGSVIARSEENVKTEFVLSLPRLPFHEEDQPIALPATDGENDRIQNPTMLPADTLVEDRPLCLIVEDHPDMQSAIHAQLCPYFNTILASDGEEGLSLAVSKIPDIILTDVLMPKLDGLKMTNYIKLNPLTSHIPVVMLSSLGETEDKIKGQLEGAEAYIAKPYHAQELLLQLFNLLTLQENWKSRYSKDTNASLHENRLKEVFSLKSIEKTDDFMSAMVDVFESHFDSESLDADEIARLLHISRPQLYRKIAAISDVSVMELLRNFRLEKATQLMLRDPEKNIKEIAFLTGFKERTHFTKSFINKYGVTPSDWKKKFHPEE